MCRETSEHKLAHKDYCRFSPRSLHIGARSIADSRPVPGVTQTPFVGHSPACVDNWGLSRGPYPLSPPCPHSLDMQIRCQVSQQPWHIGPEEIGTGTGTWSNLDSFGGRHRPAHKDHCRISRRALHGGDRTLTGPQPARGVTQSPVIQSPFGGHRPACTDNLGISRGPDSLSPTCLHNLNL